MLSLAGFAMVAVMVVLIIRRRFALPVILIMLPTAAVLVLGLAGKLPDGNGGTAAMPEHAENLSRQRTEKCSERRLSVHFRDNILRGDG